MKVSNFKKSYEIGDEIIVSIHKPREGKFPIAKADTGIVCRLRTKEKYIEYGSMWNVRVVEVLERSLIVETIDCFRTAAADKFEAEKRLQQIVSKKPERKRKEKINYEYRRNNE